MTTPKDSNTTHVAVLRFVASQRWVSIADVHRYVLPQMSKRSVERIMARLCQARLLDRHRHARPGLGARSPDAFHLLAAGARAINQPFGNHYRRALGEDFISYRRAHSELAFQCARHGWRLLRDEHACRAALRAHLQRLAQSQHGAQLSSPAVPLRVGRIAPDVLIVGRRAAVLVAVGHPFAGRGFWIERLHRYEYVLPHVPMLALALNEEQANEASPLFARRHTPVLTTRRSVEGCLRAHLG